MNKILIVLYTKGSKQIYHAYYGGEREAQKEYKLMKRDGWMYRGKFWTKEKIKTTVVYEMI